MGVFLASPLTSHASIFTDFANWLVPSELKPTPTPVVVATQKGAGGVLITPDPVVVSGDTTDTYLISALGKRKFTIDNNGTIDLFLNKSGELYYSATPNLAPGDVPASIALNVGSERIITIANPSPRVNYYLSKNGSRSNKHEQHNRNHYLYYKSKGVISNRKWKRRAVVTRKFYLWFYFEQRDK